jgi:uncharacterized protein YndB with AHSA1/START domain
MLDPTNATESITRQVDLDLDPHAAWQAITDREALEAWLGELVDIDIRPGGTGVVVDDDVARTVTVDEVDLGRRWSFHWRSPDNSAPSLVTFEIAPRDDGGSTLTITETLTVRARADNPLAWEARVACLWAYTMAFARAR